MECCYGDYCECHQLVERCGRELDKLELERTQLLSRLEQIDKDKKKVVFHGRVTCSYLSVAYCFDFSGDS